MDGYSSQICNQSRGNVHECGDFEKWIKRSFSYATRTPDCLLFASLLASRFASPCEKWLRRDRVKPFGCGADVIAAALDFDDDTDVTVSEIWTFLLRNWASILAGFRYSPSSSMTKTSSSLSMLLWLVNWPPNCEAAITFKPMPLSTNGDAELNWCDDGICEVDVCNDEPDIDVVDDECIKMESAASTYDWNSELPKYSSNTNLATWKLLSESKFNAKLRMCGSTVFKRNLREPNRSNRRLSWDCCVPHWPCTCIHRAMHRWWKGCVTALGFQHQRRWCVIYVHHRRHRHEHL